MTATMTATARFTATAAATAAEAAAKAAELMKTTPVVREFDGGLSLTIYSGKLPLRQLLRSLGYAWSLDHRNPINRLQRGYRDNGLMSMHLISRTPEPADRDSFDCIDDDTFVIHLSVGVGCSCSHDCCGHLCRLSYEIREISGTWHVYTRTVYNY
jgi:hypothetical protein